jgi:DNA-binding transcriptional MerR regulator
MFTRKKAANALRITFPTLRIYELQGKLTPKRAGKRVLYRKEDIENFIDSFKKVIEGRIRLSRF